MITELDHGSNVAPWTAVAQERGFTVRTVKMCPDGQLDWNDLETALTPRVKLLAIHNASNVLGTITDVARATKMAHAVGAKVFVDAVHSAPHELVDVRAIDCDLLACSAYKFYGPHVGILWGRRELIESLDPPQLSTASRTSPERMQTGTQSHESIMGAEAAVNFLASLGRGGVTRRQAIESAYAVLKERSEALFADMWNGLSSVDGVTLYGPPPGMPRTPTVSFTVAARRTAAIAAALAEQGLFLSHGQFHGPTVARRLKAYDGFVRAGCSCYTTARRNRPVGRRGQRSRRPASRRSNSLTGFGLRPLADAETNAKYFAWPVSAPPRSGAATYRCRYAADAVTPPYATGR